MPDNVIKFQRKPQPKPPRQTPPCLKKWLALAAVAAFFIAAFIYFSLTNHPPGM